MNNIDEHEMAENNNNKDQLEDIVQEKDAKIIKKDESFELKRSENLLVINNCSFSIIVPEKDKPRQIERINNNLPNYQDYANQQMAYYQNYNNMLQNYTNNLFQLDPFFRFYR